jgi:hypothetical protein
MGVSLSVAFITLACPVSMSHSGSEKSPVHVAAFAFNPVVPGIRPGALSKEGLAAHPAVLDPIAAGTLTGLDHRVYRPVNVPSIRMAVGTRAKNALLHVSGDDHPELLSNKEGAVGPEEADKWTADITGDEKFDKAWKKAWQNKDSIPCPFFKRRATDVLEATLGVGRFVLARHKSLLPASVLGFAPHGKGGPKRTGLATAAVLEAIRRDFEEKRYYITGKMTREIYSDACYFDSPDPDMPVQGLEKYINAISKLFASGKSKVDLLDLEILAPDLLLSRWRLEATVALPWRPSIKAYTGVTLYELDEDGLISRHTELWSISATDAFLSTVFPKWPGAALPAPTAAELMEMPAHQRSPDPMPLLRRAAANRLKPAGWSLPSLSWAPKVAKRRLGNQDGACCLLLGSESGVKCEL